VKFYRCYPQIIYGCILISSGIILIFGAFIFPFLTIRASSRLHHKLITKILRCPMSFFERTPVGHLLNRFGVSFLPHRVSSPDYMFVTCYKILQYIMLIRLYSKNSANLRYVGLEFFQAFFTISSVSLIHWAASLSQYCLRLIFVLRLKFLRVWFCLKSISTSLNVAAMEMGANCQNDLFAVLIISSAKTPSRSTSPQI